MYFSLIIISAFILVQILSPSSPRKQLTPLYLKITEDQSINTESSQQPIFTTSYVAQNTLKSIKKRQQRSSKLSHLQKKILIRQLYNANKIFLKNRFKKSYRDKNVTQKCIYPYLVPGQAQSNIISQLRSPQCIQFLYFNSIKSESQEQKLQNRDYLNKIYFYPMMEQGEQLIYELQNELTVDYQNGISQKIYQQSLGRYLQPNLFQFPQINAKSCSDYAKVAIMFSQVATYVQLNKDQEIDLLEITKQVADTAKKLLNLDKEKYTLLFNHILIAYTMIKVK